jgi:hypothetical protein
MTKRSLMSPPKTQQPEPPKSTWFSRVLFALLLIFAAAASLGTGRANEASVTELATQLSHRWEESVSKAPLVLAPIR